MPRKRQASTSESYTDDDDVTYSTYDTESTISRSKSRGKGFRTRRKRRMRSTAKYRSYKTRFPVTKTKTTRGSRKRDGRHKELKETKSKGEKNESSKSPSRRPSKRCSKHNQNENRNEADTENVSNETQNSIQNACFFHGSRNSCTNFKRNRNSKNDGPNDGIYLENEMENIPSSGRRAYRTRAKTVPTKNNSKDSYALEERIVLKKRSRKKRTPFTHPNNNSNYNKNNEIIETCFSSTHSLLRPIIPLSRKRNSRKANFDSIEVLAYENDESDDPPASRFRKPEYSNTKGKKIKFNKNDEKERTYRQRSRSLLIPKEDFDSIYNSKKSKKSEKLKKRYFVKTRSRQTSREGMYDEDGEDHFRSRSRVRNTSPPNENMVDVVNVVRGPSLDRNNNIRDITTARHHNMRNSSPNRKNLRNEASTSKSRRSRSQLVSRDTRKVKCVRKSSESSEHEENVRDMSPSKKTHIIQVNKSSDEENNSDTYKNIRCPNNDEEMITRNISPAGRSRASRNLSKEKEKRNPNLNNDDDRHHDLQYSYIK